MSGAFGTFLVGIIYLAVLFVLVRPGSQGPTLVTNVADGLSNLVNSGTGGGGWAAKLFNLAKLDRVRRVFGDFRRAPYPPQIWRKYGRISWT